MTRIGHWVPRIIVPNTRGKCDDPFTGLRPLSVMGPRGNTIIIVPRPGARTRLLIHELVLPLGGTNMLAKTEMMDIKASRKDQRVGL
ncbi:hypothetical protein AVEN_253617-1 [Araneus ventricosus]|uniref:Uncharacterized protein n=1 Tax=Araneus ventricosus TaxID=182803 RepID=A0A4Y2CBN9_ARAVE|nr:hypothetical protein AVEN_253617-1 [Araneus ventricosus]